MPIYIYVGQTVNGKKVSGEIDAIDITDAKGRIRQLRVVPLRVEEAKLNTSQRKSKGPSFIELLFAPKVKSKDMQVFTRQFSTLINAGINVGESLKILETGMGTPLLRQVIGRVRLAIEGGKGLGDAMSLFPMTFDNFYCNMVRAGEASGSLDIILNRMSVYMEKSEKLKSQVKGAMTYPIMIIIITCLVISGILIFVIPKFQEMYSASGSQLPQLTQFIIEMSTFLRKKWYVIITVLVAIPTSIIAYYKTEDGKKSIDQFFIKAPLFGELIVKASVARFSRTMSTLLSSGVPLIEAIEAAAKTVGNIVIETTLQKAKESVSAGKGFAAPLSKLKILPSMVSQMAEIGEQTGALDAMLAKVADFYEDEVENAIKSMTVLIEPLLLVFIGAIIAVILIAMYLPIFGMADAVTKGAGG